MYKVWKNQNIYHIDKYGGQSMSSKNPNPIKHDWTVEDHAESLRAVVRQAQRKRRALAKAVGLCSMCGSRVHAPGRLTCNECNDRVKAYNKRRRTT